MIDGPLSSYSSVSSVTNVCLFICDSLRFDYLPGLVERSGISARSIAPSSFTAASVPSLITGKYPSKHGIWTFHDILPNTPPLLDFPHLYRADTIWTDLKPKEKPPVRITRANPGTDMDDIGNGFVYIEHDKGGHSPYGMSFDEVDTPTFFENLDDYTKVPSLYQKSITTSVERFNRLVDSLNSRNILDETLVIFTSDHGELLGEDDYGGIFGHGNMIVPETIRVPTVFMGAGLPKGEEYEYLTSGTDIAPTLVGALTGKELPNVDGIDLWNSSPPNRTPRSEYWGSKAVFGRKFDHYKVVSGWTKNGGIVRHRGSGLIRIGSGLISNLYQYPSAPIVRRNLDLNKLNNIINLYLPKTKYYGDVKKTNINNLSKISFSLPPEQTTAKIPDENLRNLGYIE